MNDDIAELKLEIRNLHQDNRIQDKELQAHLIEASEERAIRRQMQADIKSLDKAVNGNGDPGVKQRVASLETQVAGLKKIVWWMMGIFGTALTTGGALSFTGVI